MSVSTSTISNRSKIKVVFLGDQNTGKTSIIERYINNTFYENPDPTVGVDFMGKNISHNGQHFRLQLWDTAGQQRFRSLVPNYLKDATCAVFVIDLSNQQTIQPIHKWMQLYEDHRSPKAVAVLCGNKKDLAPNFDQSKIESVLKKYPIPYVQVSARTGQNINNLFPTIIQQVIRASNSQSPTISTTTQKTQTQAQHKLPQQKSIKLPEPLPTATFDSNKVNLNAPQQQSGEKRKCC